MNLHLVLEWLLQVGVSHRNLYGYTCSGEFMNKQMKIAILLALSMIGLNLSLMSCASSIKTTPSLTTPQTKISSTLTLISVDKAVTIASEYVPPDILPKTDISYTTYPLDASEPIGWVIMFNFSTVQVTTEQLVKLGWKMDNNTDFGPPNTSYLWIIITVDTNTGEIMHKSATNQPYLGIPPLT